MAIDLADIVSGDGSRGFMVYGVWDLDRSGYSVASAGDVNGDGFDDLIIGAPFAYNGPGNRTGVSYVIFGAAGGFGASLDLTTIGSGDGSVGFQIRGENGNDSAGSSVASAGDVNGDGFDDMIVGAGNADGTAGKSYVIFGKAGGFGNTLDLATIGGGDGSAGFVVHGQGAFDSFGASVASAGDVNGDGFADLIVGAPTGTGATTDAGAAYVVFGKAGGFGASLDLDAISGGDGSAGFVIRGESTYSFTGQSVASAGDVNGDGFDDLIVGAPTGAGAAYVVFGKASGFSASLSLAAIAGGDGSAGFVLRGVAASDWLGRSVASAGDFNGDGAADLIVGSPKPTASGEAYVVFGKTGGGFGASVDVAAIANGDGSQGFAIAGAHQLDLAGFSVASAGDVNGDGFDDLIVGAPYGDGPWDTRPNGGNSYVIFGRAGGIGGTLDLATLSPSEGFAIFGRDGGDQAGLSVASAGDVNHDGYDDLIVGAPRSSGPDNHLYSGESYVIFGSASMGQVPGNVIDLGDGSGARAVVMWGATANEFSGFAVASAGDVNGDGFDDLIVGGGGDGPGGTRPGAGQAYIVFGSGDFGADIRHLDLADIVGGDGSKGFVVQGAYAFDNAGYSVASADLNGDGFADMIVGAPYSGGPADARTRGGAIYVIFGHAGAFAPAIDLRTIDGGDGSQGFVIYGAKAYERSGYSVASAGDLNGDGFDDIVIGAPYGQGSATKPRYNVGNSYVVYGKAGGFGPTIDLADIVAGDGSRGFAIQGVNPADKSGMSVASAGDLNGDGFADLVIGAGAADGPGNTRSYAGDSYVLFGRAGGFGANVKLNKLETGDGSRGFVIHGAAANEYAGTSVASAGDVNGDGFADLVIGADRAQVGGLSTGVSYVVFGRAGGFGPSIDLADIVAGDGSRGFVIAGVDSYGDTGAAVSSAGDVNGDGFDDLIVAAPNAGGAAGNTYVVFGKAGGFGAHVDLADIAAGDSSLGFVIRGADTDRAGLAVSAAGDIDGDGFDDLILGAPFAKGPNDTRNNGGESYVIFGSATIGGSVSAVTNLGTDGADTLVGSAGADVMIGGKGDDTLLGNGGGDVLRGGSGDDALAIGDAGFRRVEGGTGHDRLVLDGAMTLADQDFRRVDGIEGIALNDFNVDLTLGSVARQVLGGLAADGFALTIDGSAVANAAITLDASAFGRAVAIDLSGSAGTSTLTGGAGDDVLTASQGTDILRGGTGDDTLAGGAGNDDLRGQGGDDTLLGNGGNDRIGGRGGNDQISGGSGNDELSGEVGNDVLHGGSGDDILRGGAGDDTLFGDEGADRMRGDAGNDTFAFTSLSDSGTTVATRDTIFDFTQGQDRIDLSALDAVSGGADDAFTFIGAIAFSGTAGELRQTASGPDTLIQADVNGDAIADFEIQLKGSYVLQAGDFHL